MIQSISANLLFCNRLPRTTKSPRANSLCANTLLSNVTLTSNVIKRPLNNLLFKRVKSANTRSRLCRSLLICIRNRTLRTRKLRRSFIAEKYAPVIDAFYNGGTEVELATEVTFEDGRKSMLDTRLTILEAA